MNLDAGYCPTCYRREGPAHMFGLYYWYCLRHRYRWTTPAKFRETRPEALQAVRLICQKTTLILHARTQLGLTRPSGLDDAHTRGGTP